MFHESSEGALWVFGAAVVCVCAACARVEEPTTTSSGGRSAVGGAGALGGSTAVGAAGGGGSPVNGVAGRGAAFGGNGASSGAQGAGTGGVSSGGMSGAGSGGSASGGQAGSNGGNAASAGRAEGGASSARGGAGGTATAAAGGSTLLFDDFEDGNSSGWFADMGASGDDAVGNWGIVADGGGRVYQQQTAFDDQSWTIGGNVAWTDQRVEAKFKWVSMATTDCTVFLAARYQDDDSYYLMSLRADGNVKIRKRLNGSTTDLVSQKTNVTTLAGTWYSFGLSAKGGVLTAYFEGMAVGTTTDASPLVSGGVGLGVVDGVASFDDVKVTLP